jgi:hypothetical protein
LARASIKARSRVPAFAFSSVARASAASAGGFASGTIGALMFGPRTSASPQKHIAHSGSRRCAAWNARCASAWLKAKASRTPWLK